MKVGVLALQGAFLEHHTMLKKLDCESVDVRTIEELDSIDGLIIPGGESTTITLLCPDLNLEAFGKPIWGTCAGAIMLPKLSKLNIEVERNSYGRHRESFVAPLEFKSKKIDGIFIRAPRITKINPGVEVLISHNGDPVFVKQSHIMATTFHPELSDTNLIHSYFLDLVRDYE